VRWACSLPALVSFRTELEPMVRGSLPDQASRLQATQACWLADSGRSSHIESRHPVARNRNDAPFDHDITEARVGCPAAVDSAQLR